MMHRTPRILLVATLLAGCGDAPQPAAYTLRMGDGSTGSNDGGSGQATASGGQSTDGTSGGGASGTVSSSSGWSPPTILDHDGNDPYTAGCWEEFDDPACAEASTKHGESCLEGYDGAYLQERYTNPSSPNDTDSCDAEQRQEYTCEVLCMENNHNSGECVEVEVDCAGETIMSAHCVCSETPQDQEVWGLDPDGDDPGVAAIHPVWFEDPACMTGPTGLGSEPCLDSITLEEFYTDAEPGSCGHLYSYPVNCDHWCTARGAPGGSCQWQALDGNFGSGYCDCAEEPPGEGSSGDGGSSTGEPPSDETTSGTAGGSSSAGEPSSEPTSDSGGDWTASSGTTSYPGDGGEYSTGQP
ncbi:MAG: hypothetical protein K0V04_29055 [Deltaproteobacteria bacterium]|nr:hypothetical protein [Deltaproteobacteria bacterium]